MFHELVQVVDVERDWHTKGLAVVPLDEVCISVHVVLNLRLAHFFLVAVLESNTVAGWEYLDRKAERVTDDSGGLWSELCHNIYFVDRVKVQL